MILSKCVYTGISFQISSPVLANPSLNLAHPHFLLPQSTLLAIAASQYRRLSAHTTEALTLNTYALLYSTQHFSFIETLSDSISDLRRNDIASNLELLMLYIGRFTSVSRNLPHINIYGDSTLGDILESWACAETAANESVSRQNSHRRIALASERIAHMVGQGKTATPVYAARICEYLSELLGTPLCEEYAAVLREAITGKLTRHLSYIEEAEDLLEMLETNPAFTGTVSSHYQTAMEKLRIYIKDSTDTIRLGDLRLRHVRYDLLGLETPPEDTPAAAYAAGDPPPVESNFPNKVAYLIALAQYKGAK